MVCTYFEQWGMLMPLDDVPADNRKVYQGFVTAGKWLVISAAIILSLMAIFLTD